MWSSSSWDANANDGADVGCGGDGCGAENDVLWLLLSVWRVVAAVLKS